MEYPDIAEKRHGGVQGPTPGGALGEEPGDSSLINVLIREAKLFKYLFESEEDESDSTIGEHWMIILFPGEHALIYEANMFLPEGPKAWGNNRHIYKEFVCIGRLL